jgi:tRNA (cytidine/uridine-2'-O-)-methyltransferase
MFHVVLVEPEIPPNAGNVARLCAATGCMLHFVGRLGFRLDDKTLKRAGLDYWPYVTWQKHESFDAMLASMTERGRMHLVDNPSPRLYTDATFQPNDLFVFGSESKGLPASLKERHADSLIEIPIARPEIRSLNLATSVGIVVYEAIRQVNRCGSSPEDHR